MAAVMDGAAPPEGDSIYSDDASAGEVDPRSCPECGEKFEGVTWQMKRGLHRRNEHGVVGKSSNATRLRQKRGTDKPTAETPPKPRTREVKPAGRVKARVNLASLGETAAEFAAFLATTRGMVPLGRSITLISGAAGEATEDLIKGTFVDRLVQPLARMGDRGKEVVGVLGLPVATQGYVMNPNPVTERMFLGALVASMPAIVKDMKKKKRAQERLETDLSEAAELFGYAPGTRLSIEDVAHWIFADAQVAEPEPQPA